MQAAYAAEELIAELGAAFSFDGDVRHAGYIESCISLLRGDKRAFFTAANKAQAAAGSLYLPVLVGVTTGMRRGEILGLRWSDIDLKAARLTVNQSRTAGRQNGVQATEDGRVAEDNHPPLP
jgi:integrase